MNIFGPPPGLWPNNNEKPANMQRSKVQIGGHVLVAEKKNYKNGILTKGIVKEILTSKPFHTRGIKVRLDNEIVGRVQKICDP
jgi:uncharacterized repeat protein (TIGR03833 family)